MKSALKSTEWVTVGPPNTPAELAAVERLILRRLPEGEERAQVLDMLLAEPKGWCCRGCGRPMRRQNVPADAQPGTMQAQTNSECKTCWNHRKAGNA